MSLYLPILMLGAAGGRVRGLLACHGLPCPARSGGTGPSSRPTSAASSRPGSRSGIRFPVKYYLTAMLFIVFDIEIIFLYPWAVYFDKLGVFGLVEMVTFIATVLVAYVYVWRRGGLEWD